MASTLVPGAKTAPKSKDAGRTPMTVVWWPFMSNALPTMAGSALNWRLPPGVAEEDDGSGAVACVVGGEGAAHGGLNAEDLEEVGDDIDAGGGDGRVAEFEAEVIGAGEGEVAGDVLIGARAGAEFIVGVGGVSGAGEAALGGRGRDPDELFCVGKRQGAEHERVNNAEDRDVGTDRQRQDEDSDHGEAGIAAKGAQRVFEVLAKDIEAHKRACLPLMFSGLLHAAELDEGSAAGLGERHAVFDVFVDSEIDVGCEFRIEFCIESAPREEGADAADGMAEMHHAGSSFAPEDSSVSLLMVRTRSITPVRRSQ